MGVIEKTCTKCGETRPGEEFNRRSRSKDGLAPWCKKCTQQYGREWRSRPGVSERQSELAAKRYALKSEEERREYIARGSELRRNNNTPMRRLHGMTAEQYDDYVELQEGRCAICGDLFEGSARRMVIDHDHSHCGTNRGCVECVRGILCHPCNTRLGVLENVEWVAQANDYLKRTSMTNRLEGKASWE